MRKSPLYTIPLLALFLCGAMSAAATLSQPRPQAHSNVLALAALAPTFSQDDPDNPCEGDPNSQACACYMNPVADGCVNPCINDPNAPVCCGNQIICQGGGGFASFSRQFSGIKHQILPRELMRKLPRARTVQCKT